MQENAPTTTQNRQAGTQVTDRSTMEDHIDDLLEEVSRLYDRIHFLEARLNRANQRAQYWAIMFDALNDDYDNRIKAIKRSK